MIQVVDAPIVIDFPPMNAEEFYNFCMRNKDLRIERDQYGNVIVMSPVHSISGFYESEIITALGNWNKNAKQGLVFSSSAGFTLPNDAIRAADACWVSKEKWNQLTKSQKHRFAPLCPEFVVEIRSGSDKLKTLKSKMLEWIENGAQLAWLIDPKNEKAWIYRADGGEEEVTGFDKQLSGEEVLPGFVFELTSLKD